MRTERKLKRGLVAVTLASVWMPGWALCVSQQSNPPSQVLKLPDPTPREVDPHLRYHDDDPAATAAMQRAVAAQNEKRRQLILWAANELVVLSERAEAAAMAPPGDTSKAELAANVNKIETLAKNLAVAMKAQ